MDVLFNKQDPRTENRAFLAWNLSNRQRMLRGVWLVKCQERLIVSNRSDTAMIIGGALVAPMFVVHLAALIKTKMDLAGHLRLFLQSSLFRKYLNYSASTYFNLVLRVRLDLFGCF